MYPGFWEVFIGITAIVLSFFRQNVTDSQASFIRRYNKQVLLIGGLFMIAVGTVRLVAAIN